MNLHPKHISLALDGRNGLASMSANARFRISLKVQEFLFSLWRKNPIIDINAKDQHRFVSCFELEHFWTTQHASFRIPVANSVVVHLIIISNVASHHWSPRAEVCNHRLDLNESVRSCSAPHPRGSAKPAWWIVELGVASPAVFSTWSRHAYCGRSAKFACLPNLITAKQNSCPFSVLGFSTSSTT